MHRYVVLGVYESYLCPYRTNMYQLETNKSHTIGETNERILLSTFFSFCFSLCNYFIQCVSIYYFSRMLLMTKTHHLPDAALSDNIEKVEDNSTSASVSTVIISLSFKIDHRWYLLC